MQNGTPSSLVCFFFDPLWFTVVNAGMTPAVSLKVASGCVDTLDTREDKARKVSPWYSLIGLDFWVGWAPIMMIFLPFQTFQCRFPTIFTRHPTIHSLQLWPFTSYNYL